MQRFREFSDSDAHDRNSRAMARVLPWTCRAEGTRMTPTHADVERLFQAAGAKVPSVVSLKKPCTLGAALVLCAHAETTTHETAAADRRGASHAGGVGATPHHGPASGAALARGLGLRRGPDQSNRVETAARVREQRLQVAGTLPGAAPRGLDR